MKVEYLYDIIAIYNGKSIKNAAIERGITEDTLKKRIETIEKEVGKIICNTSSQALELTEDGMKFYFDAMKALAEITEYKSENIKKQRKKELNIAMDINVFHGTLYTCSNSIAKKYNIKFNVIQQFKSDVIDGVISGKYDTGLIILDNLTREKIKQYGLDYNFLCTRRPVIIVSKNHPLAKFKRISLSKLEKYQRVSLANSFEECYYFQDNTLIKHKLSRSNMVYKYIEDILLTLKYGENYFIGGCNEDIDLRLNDLSVIEIVELTERLEVVCIYPKTKTFLEPLKEILDLSQELKVIKE